MNAAVTQDQIDSSSFYEHGLSPPEPIRILLVEDDEDDYILTRDTLMEMGSPICTLDWASTYEAGFELFHQHRHDLYFFDFRLGVRTGLDLLRAARATDEYAPIMLLTGSGGELIAAEALRLGAADYLPKSLMSVKSLHRAITNALEKSYLRRTLMAHRHHLEHTNQILTKQNQEIQRFYHTLAHELKTPLTATREFTALLLDELAGPLTPEQREYLQTSQECVDQMTKQINDLLDITRLDTGKLSLERKPVDLSSLISRVVAALRSTAQPKSIAISVSTQLDNPIAWIDASRITQVLTNLLSNAIKFTPQEGVISVEAQETLVLPSMIRVSVSDTGCGMAPEHLEHIFDRLFQVEDGHSRVEGGLGLGLTITREIMKLHGGDISVRSQMGKGTTFILTLPREIPPSTLNRATEGGAGEAQNSHS